MSKVAKMMAARSTGGERMGFDMRSESERRGGNGRRMHDDSDMRMGGYERYERGENNGARYERGNDMRMGGYESPESVRRSPRTGRFIRGEMNDAYDRRRDADTGRYMRDDRRMNDDHYIGDRYRMNDDRRMAMDMEDRRGNDRRMRYGTSRPMDNAEHDDDDEDDDMEFSEKVADEWTRAMKNEDGSKGPHWSKEQTRAIMVQHGIVCDPLEFFAVMNSMYSDYSAVAKRYGVDRPDFYAHMAKAWLEDKDAVEDKAAAYFNYVVKHDGQKKHSPSKARVSGDSDFLKSVNGKDSAKAWEIMDELMETLYSLGHTRVYDSVMRRMEEL